MSTKDNSVYEALKEEFGQEAYNVDKSRGFQLIGIRSAFVTERLSEVFGLVGTGWRFVHSPFEKEGKEVITEVALQYRMDKSDGPGSYPVVWSTELDSFVPDTSGIQVWSEPVFGSGGNQVGSGGVPVSDARKSAVSNALSKAASRMGVGIQAYKGVLVIDGEKVVAKDESGSTPGDVNNLVRQLLGLSFLHSPDDYDNLTAKNTVARSYHESLIGNVASRIKGANLTEFVAENLQTLVGNKQVKKIGSLKAREIKRLSDIANSIIDGTLTWEDALKLAQENPGKEWSVVLEATKKEDDS